jgi:Kef-type K+ transport system membrane component KefB
MRHRLNHPPTTPLTFLYCAAWTAFTAYVYYTHNPMAEWVFIGLILALITITIIAKVKDHTPIHPKHKCARKIRP